MTHTKFRIAFEKTSCEILTQLSSNPFFFRYFIWPLFIDSIPLGPPDGVNPFRGMPFEVQAGGGQEIHGRLWSLSFSWHPGGGLKGGGLNSTNHLWKIIWLLQMIPCPERKRNVPDICEFLRGSCFF